MNDKLLQKLNQFNMNISEYHVLKIISLDGHSKRKGLSDYIYRYFYAVSPPIAQTIDEYENAINSCLEKSFLKILTIDDCFKDEKRWLNDDNQNLDGIPYKPNNLDFTKSGAKLYSDVLDSLSDKKWHMRFNGSICYKWKHEGILSILSKLKKDIISELNKLHEPGVLEDAEQIIDIGKPYPIGPWWITRFDRLRKGWRVDIKYK